MDALVAAAKAEGGLTTIALPRDWCNYGAAIDGFTAKYGIPINGLNPGGGSKDELAAIKANKDNPGPAAPDVVDVGLAFGPQGVDQGLFQPYKVSTWDTIPDSAKSADGMWYGDYFGVMSFEVNTKVVTDVPKDWADLLKPEYKKMVALAGDPPRRTRPSPPSGRPGFRRTAATSTASRKASTSSSSSTMPATSSRSSAARPPSRAATRRSASRWTYNGLADKDSLKGNPPIEVVVPTSGRFGGMYVQAISAYAPHPNAAKLWMEYLYSDEGQNIWLSGLLQPDPLRRHGGQEHPRSGRAGEAARHRRATVLPTLAQITAASKAITAGWPTVVGVTVK